MKKDANKICVLLAEDDMAIRETMVMVLESEGFEVHSAEDGQDALGQIAQAKVLPDLLITDLMMPNVTGWELVDVIKKLNRTKNIPIIVYSAVAHYAAGNPVLTGCYFERKPVELDHLMLTIRQALGRPAQDVRTKNSTDYITTSEHVRDGTPIAHGDKVVVLKTQD